MNPRIEQKLEINKLDYISVLNWLKSKSAQMLYPERLICSVYFDNFRKDMYSDTNEGLIPRKKIRIRTYDSRNFLNSNSKYNLETKLTTEYKRYKEIKEDINPILLINKGIYDNLYGICFPLIEISYLREYFILENFRITIDRDIIYRDVENTNNFLNKKIKDNCFVLEIKTDINQDLNYIRNLFEFPRTKFSKYERGIDALFEFL